jgi:hypothetical protein
VEVPDPGFELLGSGITVIDWLVVGIADGGRNPAAELEDQGVFRWPVRWAGVCDGPATDVWRAGKRSGGLGAGV